MREFCFKGGEDIGARRNISAGLVSAGDFVGDSAGDSVGDSHGRLWASELQVDCCRVTFGCF